MFKWIDDFLKPYHITPTDKSIFDKIIDLEEKYNALLLDIKRLEEENVETTNCLYENANSIDAVDARIDILAEHCGITEDV